MNITGNTNNMAYLQQFAVKVSKNKSAENPRTVVWNRCSTEKQQTLEQQEADCLILIKELNLELVKIFGVKESAKTDDGKAFLEMLEFCDKNNIGHIVVHNYDRFTRSGDVGLLKKLRQDGTRVHSVKQRVDDETSSGQFSQNLFVLFAKWENDQRRDRVLLGQRAKLRKGEWIGKPTTGYKKDWVNGKQMHDLEKKQCLINEDGFKLRQAFFWKDRENLTNLKIIERLREMGLNLNPPQLTRIFRNPFYCGYITHSMLDDGEIIRGKHVPLVSEEVFLRVNGIVNNYRHGYKVVRRYDEMPLKSSVFCGDCGRPITAYPTRNGTYIYYKCPNTGCCFNIRNIKLHDLFAAELSKLTIDGTLIPVIKTQLEKTYYLLHESDAAREKPMKEELTHLKNELKIMQTNWATNKIPTDLYEELSKAHQEKINDIESSLEDLSKDSSNLGDLLENALKLATNLLNLWQLSDFDSKVRLQKLLFPEGLQYISENKLLRTPKINPIFSAITSISIYNENDFEGQSLAETEKLRQLYLMFASSNFFWEQLSEINSQLIGFEQYYPQIWHNNHDTYLNMSSGGTETAMFHNISNHNMGSNEKVNINLDWVQNRIETISGGTHNSLS